MICDGCGRVMMKGERYVPLLPDKNICVKCWYDLGYLKEPTTVVL